MRHEDRPGIDGELRLVVFEGDLFDWRNVCDFGIVDEGVNVVYTETKECVFDNLGCLGRVTEVGFHSYSSGAQVFYLRNDNFDF